MLAEQQSHSTAHPEIRRKSSAHFPVQFNRVSRYSVITMSMPQKQQSLCKGAAPGAAENTDGSAGSPSPTVANRSNLLGAQPVLPDAHPLPLAALLHSSPTQAWADRAQFTAPRGLSLPLPSFHRVNDSTWDKADNPVRPRTFRAHSLSHWR